MLLRCDVVIEASLGSWKDCNCSTTPASWSSRFEVDEIKDETAGLAAPRRYARPGSGGGDKGAKLVARSWLSSAAC